MKTSAKLATIQNIATRVEDGETVGAACSANGVTRAWFYRWKERLEAEGVGGLAERKSTGRPPSMTLSDDEAAQLRYHRLKHDSIPLAVQAFVESGAASPEVSARLLEILDAGAEKRRRASWPLCVRRACHVSAEEVAQFRGKKAAADCELVVRRSMEWVDEDGHTHALQPGDLWESDDMSSNIPFRYADPETGEERLGRQTLLTQDVYSAHWLGVSPVGRPADAYRAEDIAEHMLACVDAWGLPKFWRLERGRWENVFIDGVKLDKLGDDFAGRRWGGLADIIHIQRAFTSRGKGLIEGSFDHLQAIMAHAVPGADIGRVRGEFEEATRHLLRAGRGKGASLARFPDMGGITEIFCAACDQFNREAKQREAFGRRAVVPAELFAERPAKRELPAAERWRFLPVKRLATVRQGGLSMAVEHWGTQSYQVNGALDHHLAHGHRVLVALHPGRPELGCHVFNADMGSANRHSWPFGLPLGIAPSTANAPQIDLRRDVAKAGGKRKQRAAMRSEFAQIKAAGAEAEAGGGNLLRVRTAVDGGGRAARSRTAPEPDYATAGEDQNTTTDDERRPLGADGARGEPATGPLQPCETKRRGVGAPPGTAGGADREAERERAAKLAAADWDHF